MGGLLPFGFRTAPFGKETLASGSGSPIVNQERDTLEAEGPSGENHSARHPCDGFNPDRHCFSRCLSVFGGYLDWLRARSNRGYEGRGRRPPTGIWHNLWLDSL